MITGYKLQHALRELRTELDVVTAQFADSLLQFPDIPKPKPLELYPKIMSLEERIAAVQIVQAKYNLGVQVEVEGRPMTLAQAVKMVGGAGRGEKMWRSFAAPKKDRYEFRDTTSRDKDHVYAERTISAEACLEEAKKAAKKAAALREAIQVGNATELDLDVEPGLLP